MIACKDNIFELHTDNTSYIFRATESGQLEHIYYGKRVHADIGAMSEAHTFIPGNTNAYSDKFPNVALEDMSLEVSALGKGDVRELFVEVVCEDGSRTLDFVYESATVLDGREALSTLPCSYGEPDEVEQLRIKLVDKWMGLELALNYCVYPHCDVITRNAVLTNIGEGCVRVKRLMSMQLDMDNEGYVLSTFNGSWTNEMNRHECRMTGGKHVNSSVTGTSSNRANPFIMLAGENTTQDAGVCFGFNLVYSGNHMEVVEADAYGRLRILCGINPATFEWKLESGGAFEAPEAVMTFSDKGFNEMSHHMHEFVRNHIVRGEWKNRVRPVLLNSWEAAYFDINENKLLKLAAKAATAGVELFVVDDGWFKGRTGDSRALGDWTADAKKFPDGLGGMANRLKRLGLDMGIWVEPEMVSVDSDLYRAHLDWAIAIPGRPHTEGRHQRILDLSREEVVQYIIKSISDILNSADITYVKWDMNRIFSDYYSNALDSDRQGELAHRYVCGLYRCMKALTEAFPHVLFEGCSAGGNRFDLGILSYFPQIWGSDNTDAVVRARIQDSYSYGYPPETVSAHVSDCPNHQTMRTTPLDTRYTVASFGTLGYECNLCDMKKEQLEAIKGQIELYKQWREVLQKGTFYRCDAGSRTQWCVVSKDRTRAVGMLMYSLGMPDMRRDVYKAKGLDADKRYHFYNAPGNVDIRAFGGLVNTMSPVHIKPESWLMDVAAKVVKLSGEKEDYVAFGDMLMNCGVRLKQGYAATGYSDEVRVMGDFGARRYYMQEVSDS